MGHLIVWAATISCIRFLKQAHFKCMINLFMPEAVRKNWAPPKHKLFAYHILQNRVWLDDRL
jgi:hypothetical protein